MNGGENAENEVVWGTQDHGQCHHSIECILLPNFNNEIWYGDAPPYTFL